MPESPTQVVYNKQGPVLVLRSALLRVVSGPDAGASCPVGLQRVGVGAAQDNGLVLTDPQVSRHHLEIRVQDHGYQVVDLESTNGSFYRGARIHDAALGIGSEVRLGATVLRLERAAERTEEVSAIRAFGGLVGNSGPMQRVYGLLAAVAPTDTTVLIQGETGTGKELVAAQLHRRSPRQDHSFAVVDCASLPPGLIESELFGHERGAFTGAVGERAGVFEKCRGGTVFLDEIGELPLELQTRLLRVLDRRIVKRVGSNLERKVDVRLVAATNRDLSSEVAAGRFRKDLFYRLAVVRIALPPLRKRRDDIPVLARHFLVEAGCIDPQRVLTPQVQDVLNSRRWTGNVRELRNVIERAVVLSDGSEGLLDEVTREQAPQATPDGPPLAGGGYLARALPPQLMGLPYKELKRLVVEELEDLYIGRLHARHGNNISRIAQEAGVDRHLVRKVLQRQGRYGGGD